MEKYIDSHHKLEFLYDDLYQEEFGEEFQENFDYIVKYAVKLGVWKDENYENNATDYCGVEITSSPCDNDGCTKSSLDHFFKESLLDN